VAQSKRPGLSVVSQNLNEKLDVSKIVLDRHDAIHCGTRPVRLGSLSPASGRICNTYRSKFMPRFLRMICCVI
jgi:hypothetical protein